MLARGLPIALLPSARCGDFSSSQRAEAPPRDGLPFARAAARTPGPPPYVLRLVWRSPLATLIRGIAPPIASSETNTAGSSRKQRTQLAPFVPHNPPCTRRHLLTQSVGWPANTPLGRGRHTALSARDYVKRWILITRSRLDSGRSEPCRGVMAQLAPPPPRHSETPDH